ncbi:DUF4058 family protein [Chlorogloeopsis fritschii PCC 9212]|uniref:DUF4058 domain-containing protein n=1 Tax=Chlorogloeopsis fritschii PCC 6912 TaxID=211165 RepID=A0A3S1A1F5_CHLFR|nr:DUF4058 family protein [Chlorogloeopsis fritschii]RUR85117.1 hypothetical protein PCC6912_12330 [Chlorogloeopsis fritschii PCC 6912]
MPSPFPGMNPYLEHPELFPGLHHWLIIEIARFLSPQLRPKYRVAVEVRMYETTDENSLLVGIPDVTVKSRQTTTDEKTTNVAIAAPTKQPMRVTIPMPLTIREGYLEVREVGTEALITTIEILSPSNKRTGKGRQMYEEKREQVLGSRTNLVEIDLLRKGEPMPFFDNGIVSHYRILVCRGDRRPYADLYAFNLQDAIPNFPLPLRSGDNEPVIDLQALLNEVYDVSGYDLVVDYSQEAVPALSEQDAVWADALLREKGLR